MEQQQLQMVQFEDAIRPMIGLKLQRIMVGSFHWLIEVHDQSDKRVFFSGPIN